ncbi:MAG: hypothetical protein HY799_06760 [Nitrosomonadales bacterium]|nr:hypothetical protein [Nitrosomonadales bacterium]
MKFAMNFLSLLFAALILSNTAYAESPREQLKQMVGQLQANPDDDALREKIIKFAQKLKPAPAIPEEAERRMARGTAAFKGAKSIADYQKAAQEFDQATLAAPWYGDAYFNLGVTQDKAENYESALRSLKLAILAIPNSKDIKALIYEVEYRSENSPEARAAKERSRDQALLLSINGARYSYDKEYQSAPGSVDKYTFDIRGNEVIMGSSFSAGQYQRQNYPEQILDSPWKEIDRSALAGRQFSTSKPWLCDVSCPPTCARTEMGGRFHWNCPMTGIIREDGNSIEFTGNGTSMIFKRER